MAKEKKETQNDMDSDKNQKKRMTKTLKAGLVVPVAKINKRIVNARHTERVGGPTAVTIAATVEYILEEIIGLAADNVRSGGKYKRIRPRDVVLSIRSDADLARLFASHRILSGDKLKSSADDFTLEADRKYKSMVAQKKAEVA